MNRIRLIGVLVASHALAAAAAYLWFRQPAAPAGGDPALNIEALRKPGSLVRPPSGSTTGKSAASAPAAVPRTAPFHWSQVESSDYRKYIGNLRAIGCPEQTIKDLIITDVMKHYAARRGALKDNGREFRYWETAEKRSLTARQLAEREKDLARIDKELPAVLRELLGVNYERELNRYFVDTHEDDKRLAFLSDAKRGQILTVRELVEEMRERLLEQIGEGKPTAAQAERLKAIQELRTGLLAQTLSPAELEQYELNTSSTADKLRQELVGFEPTEEEFKFLFKLRREHEEKFAFAGTDQPDQQAAEQKQIEEAIRRQLGSARAAEYERSRNPNYRDLVLFQQLHELPNGTAQAIHEMRSAAFDVRAQLLADRKLTAEQRTAALGALQEEVATSLRQTLGEKLYQSFANGTGGWVTTLGTGR